MAVMLTDEQVAQVVHETHMALNAVLGDPAPSPPWAALPPEGRHQVVNMVAMIKEGASPPDVHETWVAIMLARGWVHGEVKDPTAVPPTHPAMTWWDELDIWYQRKVLLAFKVVEELGWRDAFLEQCHCLEGECDGG